MMTFQQFLNENLERNQLLELIKKILDKYPSEIQSLIEKIAEKDNEIRSCLENMQGKNHMEKMNKLPFHDEKEKDTVIPTEFRNDDDLP